MFIECWLCDRMPATGQSFRDEKDVDLDVWKNFTVKLIKELIILFYKLFYRLKELIYKIDLKAKQMGGTEKKLQISFTYEITLSEILTNQIQEYVFFLMTKWSLSQECKDGLAVEKCIQVIYHIFRLNEKMFFIEMAVLPQNDTYI